MCPLIVSKLRKDVISVCMAGVLLLAAFLQFDRITFGLPGLYRFDGETVDYWYGDEDKELAHIESYLQPKAILLPFNYPPFQYLLVAAANLPTGL